MLVAQCKRFAKPVGNKAVQEVVAGLKFYKANIGVVIAPNGFTNSAEDLSTLTIKKNNLNQIFKSKKILLVIMGGLILVSSFLLLI